MKMSPLAIAVSETHRPAGGGNRLVGGNGELNGSSKADLMKNILELAQAVSSGSFDGAEAEVASASERQDRFLSAYNDKHGQGWAELGSGIAAEITDAVARSGFMRRYVARAEVAQGSIVRVRARIRQTTAVMATGPAALQTQFVRDQYLMPTEFYVEGRVAVEDREMDQGSGDILTERYNEGLEAFMVQEDLVLTKLMDTAAPIFNNMQYFSGAFTPNVVSALQSEVQLWSLPAVSILMAQDLLPDLQGSGTWGTYLDPVSKLEVLLTGRLATVFGMDLMTDGFRQARLRVVQNGTLYCTSSPEMLGAYTDRGPVKSEPLSSAQLAAPGRGFHMTESISCVVANARAVSKAVRT